jgi:O-antigen/teichoic acid export membrane protein
MNNMEYERILKAGSNLFIGKIGTVIIGFVNLIILTRIFTIEEMGKYSLFLMVVNLALTVGLNWSDASIVRHGREEYVNSKKINKSFWARFYLFFPFLIFFVLLFIIFSKKISNFIGIDHGLIVLVISMFVLYGLINYFIYIFQSIDQMKKSAYVLFFQKLIYLLCLIPIFFQIFNVKLSLVLIMINLSFLIILIVNLIRFDYKIISPYHFDKTYFKKIWSFSWPQLLGFSGLYVINYVDLYFIRKYMTLSDVGIYSIAYGGFVIIIGIVHLMNTLFMPLIVEYKTNKNFNLIKSYMRKIPLLSLGWIFLVALGLMISKFVIPLFFSVKYVAAISPFNILLITSIFSFISICLLPIINAFDLIIHIQVINLITAIINILGNIMLVPKIGLIGAAYATMIALFISLLLKLILVYYKKNIIFGVSK